MSGWCGWSIAVGTVHGSLENMLPGWNRMLSSTMTEMRSRIRGYVGLDQANGAYISAQMYRSRL